MSTLDTLADALAAVYSGAGRIEAEAVADHLADAGLVLRPMEADVEQRATILALQARSTVAAAVLREPLQMDEARAEIARRDALGLPEVHPK